MIDGIRDGEPMPWVVTRYGKDIVAGVIEKVIDALTSKFDYRLRNRSAIGWVINQYQVKTDKPSGINNDPNRPADEQYIVRLIGQVIAVSLETVEIVRALPRLEIPDLEI